MFIWSEGTAASLLGVFIHYIEWIESDMFKISSPLIFRT